MFDGMKNSIDPQKLQEAKEELQKAARPASKSSTPTVPLPIILDVFVRVFGARVPAEFRTGS